MLNIQKNCLIFIWIFHFYLKEKIEKGNKIVSTIQDKKLCCPYQSFKQALNHGSILKKVHRVIQFNQEAWLKPYIDMNTKLRTVAKNDFEKDFFKLMNIAVFGKTMQNVRRHRDIKLVTTHKRRNQLASEPNYHYKKILSRKFDGNRNDKHESKNE